MAEYVYMATKTKGGYQAIVMVLPGVYITDAGFGSVYPKKVALEVAKSKANQMACWSDDIVRPER